MTTGKNTPRKKKTVDSNPLSTDEEGKSSCCCWSRRRCFFCDLKEPDPRLRRPALAAVFREIPYRDDESDVLVMSALWNIAMTCSDDPELPSLGALHCMSLLVTKALADPAWLGRHQNIFIPYYAAHVLGSYTICSAGLADLAVEAGTVAPLLGLLRGELTWVEQRVAVRALGHLASYPSTFPAVAEQAEELVPLAMSVACTCLEAVYGQFVGVPPADREQYHRDLLTRGLGGAEMEDRKAEEWASQLQCWSLYLLSCFADRDASSHDLICRDVEFLKALCQMWGGLANGDSPAGVGLMRILCRSDAGREAIGGCREAVESLCDLSRSSDDWQYMGIDCLLLLIQGLNTRSQVMAIAAPSLVDLAELRSLGARKKLGDKITEALLMDPEEHCIFDMGGEAERAIKSLWELKVERKKREEAMTKENLTERHTLAALKKQEGNERFWSGEIEEAIARYTEALELCPLEVRKERLVLYSNRAQCHLLLRDPDAAISDATRALALARTANGHGKSLWRRSQAYDMKGMAKESLMDCLMFVNGWLEGKKGERRRAKVPYYAARMINKQMGATGLFATMAVGKKPGSRREEDDGGDDQDEEEQEDGMRSSNSGLGLPTIVEEPRLERKLDKGKEIWGRARERLI